MSSFPSFVAPSETKKQLKRQFSTKRIAQAYLFFGPEGSATLPMCQFAIAHLLCTHPKHASRPCNDCTACKRTVKWLHPDLHLFFPIALGDAEAKREALLSSYTKCWRSFVNTHPYGSYEDWQCFFNEQSGIKSKQLVIGKEEAKQILQLAYRSPYEGKANCLLVWLPERMHPSAVNALLKTVEDPTSRTFFFFVSHEPEELLPTLRSRTQPVWVRPFSTQEVAKELKENGMQDEKEANHVARLAQGNLSRAFRLAKEGGKEDAAVVAEQVRTWLRACWKKDYATLYAHADTFHKQTTIQQRDFLLLSLKLLREVLLCKIESSKLFHLSEEEHEFATNLSKVILHRQLPTLYTLWQEALEHLGQNALARLVFLDTSCQVGELFSEAKRWRQERQS